MSPRLSHFMRYQFPALVWAGLIFASSSIPGSKFPNFVLLHHDKLIHTGIFLVFGLLIYRALMIRSKDNSFDFQRALIVIFCVVVYGASDEFHQSFVPGRTPDVWDATADTIGGILSLIIIFIYSRKRSSAPPGPR